MRFLGSSLHDALCYDALPRWIWPSFTLLLCTTISNAKEPALSRVDGQTSPPLQAPDSHAKPPRDITLRHVPPCMPWPPPRIPSPSNWLLVILPWFHGHKRTRPKDKATYRGVEPRPTGRWLRTAQSSGEVCVSAELKYVREPGFQARAPRPAVAGTRSSALVITCMTLSRPHLMTSSIYTYRQPRCFPP